MIQISVVRVVILTAPFRSGSDRYCFVFFGAVISAALIVAVFIFESFDEFFSFIIFSLVGSDQRFPLCGTPWAPARHFCVSPRRCSPPMCVVLQFGRIVICS